MNEFVFDPRVFIRPPYITCPNCGAEVQFGVLMIGWGYTRRCRECWFTERYDLPEIRKRVIYLDQMAISDMMKALNPACPAYERVDPFWRELFEKLDVLKKLQVIVCPDSATHRAESAVAPDPKRFGACTSSSRSASPSTTDRRYETRRSPNTSLTGCKATPIMSLSWMSNT
jgi:hypothetical protein